MANVPGPPPGQAVAQVRTPERWTAGTYANGMGVWFSSTEFVLDFLVNLPMEEGTDPFGNQVQVVPLEVVGRIRIPPPLIFQIARNLADAMTQYEAANGKIADFTGQTLGRPDDTPPSTAPPPASPPPPQE